MLRSCSILIVLCAATACATSPREEPGDTVRARRAASAPALDGAADDATWRDATWLVRTLESPAGRIDARVAAAVTGDEIHMCVRWADTTEDRDHRPWTFAGGSWKPGAQLEDVLAVGFPISGEFTADMEAPVECVWDVWHWKACRTDPAGYAMDKSHVHTMTDPGGKRHASPVADGRTVYIRRPEDAGTSATRTMKEPAHDGGPTVAQFEAQAPTGSAADVRARGAWKDGWWTVELSRKLDTGNADDAPLAHGTTIPFALATLDHDVDEHHAVSGKLHLVIE